MNGRKTPNFVISRSSETAANAPMTMLETAAVRKAAADVLVYLGFNLGLSGNTISDRQPKWVFAGALALLVVLWTLGRVI